MICTFRTVKTLTKIILHIKPRFYWTPTLNQGFGVQQHLEQFVNQIFNARSWKHILQ